MLKSLHISALNGALPPEEAFPLIRSLGYDGVELVLSGAGLLTMETTDAEAIRLRDLAWDAGLRVSGVTNGVLWRNPLTSDDADKRRAGIRSMARQAELLDLMDAHVGLVIPGYVGTDLFSPSEVVRYDIALRRAEEGLAEGAPFAEALGVQFAIENVWNRMLLSPVETRDFVDRIASPALGVYFDIANVLWTGYPEHWLDILGHRVLGVHVKDFRRAVGTLAGFCDIGAGDANLPEVLRALRGAKYDGWLTVEIHHDMTPAGARRASWALDGLMKLDAEAREGV